MYINTHTYTLYMHMLMCTTTSVVQYTHIHTHYRIYTRTHTITCPRDQTENKIFKYYGCAIAGEVEEKFVAEMYEYLSQ